MTQEQKKGNWNMIEEKKKTKNYYPESQKKMESEK